MYKVSADGVLKHVETWHLVLPLHDNNKNAFPKELLDSVIDRIADSFPGMSVVSTSGRWKESGVVYSDNSLTVIVDALPTDHDASKAFFETLKRDLATKLRQEKIYVTLAATRSELLTIDEFLAEMGIESKEVKSDKLSLANTLAAHIDITRVRASYETTLLRRLPDTKQIQWERKLCGLKLTSVFDDPFPPNARLLAADRVTDFTFFWDGNIPEAIAVVGDYEFQRFLVRNESLRPLVPVSLPPDTEDEFIAPAGKTISAQRFIEEFTGVIVVGYVALREEGFLQSEITVSVGSDGSVQMGQRSTERGKTLLVSPASLTNSTIRNEVARCAQLACNSYELGTLDPLALAQAKAMHRSVHKRAAARYAFGQGNGGDSPAEK
jgi:hypothetical protein